MGAWRAAALATEFGFAVVGSLVGGVLAGQALDRWLGTAPAFFLAGLVLGLLASVYLMYAIYRVQVEPRRRAESAPGSGTEREGATGPGRASSVAAPGREPVAGQSPSQGPMSRPRGEIEARP